MMALPIVTHFLFVSLALAAPFQNHFNSPSLKQQVRRTQPFQRSVSDEIFKRLVLAEQYAAAAYCPSNSVAPMNKVSCSPGNCPAVESSGARIIAPMKT